MRKSNQNTLKIIFSLFIFLFFPPILPINTYADNLVSGIDTDLLIGKHISDFDCFERTVRAPGVKGLVVSYSVKADPNDPETRLFWGKKRDEPFYRRGMKLDIGVFPSIKEAHKAMNTVTSQTNPKIITPASENNGIEIWEYPMSDTKVITYKNLILHFQVWGDLEKIDWLNALQDDILNQKAGVMVSDEVKPPVIFSEEIATKEQLHIKGTDVKEFSLLCVDPNGGKTYKQVWTSISGNLMISTFLNEEPKVKWEDNKLTITGRSKQKSGSTYLNVLVANDLCVMSSLWRKEIVVEP